MRWDDMIQHLKVLSPPTQVDHTGPPILQHFQNLYNSTSPISSPISVLPCLLVSNSYHLPQVDHSMSVQSETPYRYKFSHHWQCPKMRLVKYFQSQRQCHKALTKVGNPKICIEL